MGISNWEWNHSCCIISPTEVQYSSRQGISKKGQERMEIKYQNIQNLCYVRDGPRICLPPE